MAKAKLIPSCSSTSWKPMLSTGFFNRCAKVAHATTFTFTLTLTITLRKYVLLNPEWASMKILDLASMPMPLASV